MSKETDKLNARINELEIENKLMKELLANGIIERGDIKVRRSVMEDSPVVRNPYEQEWPSRRGKHDRETFTLVNDMDNISTNEKTAQTCTINIPPQKWHYPPSAES